MAKPKQEIEYNPQVVHIEEYQQDIEPYWKEIGGEKSIFRAAFKTQRPLAFKGPTGCGKTTFVKRMHWELSKELSKEKFTPKYSYDDKTGLYIKNDKSSEQSPYFPLYIIDGTEDTDVIQIYGGLNHTGKYIGGPLYHWAHTGGILLVNELAEMRSDVQTAFHTPMDKDRTVTFLDLEKIVKIPEHAMIVATYNPGYQKKLAPVKTSTKQRLLHLKFNYPDAETETDIIYNASKIKDRQIDKKTAKALADLAVKIRSSDKEKSILATREGVSTRLLVMAAELITYGTSPLEACRAAIIEPLANNDKEAEALESLIKLSGF